MNQLGSLFRTSLSVPWQQFFTTCRLVKQREMRTTFYWPANIINIFGLPQAIDLPGTESHGGLLGYDRQNFYLSMSLEIDNWRAQKNATSVQEGTNGAVQWGLETITMKYGTANTVIVEASPVRKHTVNRHVVTFSDLRLWFFGTAHMHRTNSGFHLKGQNTPICVQAASLR